jgi:uncharacterized protein (TIGR03435 family)
VAVVGGVAVLSAQDSAEQSAPAFEVASVKPRTLPGPATITQPQGARPGGAFEMVNSTVARLVMYAYDLRDYQVAGGPNWVRAERFDVVARAGRDASTGEIRRMLQSLLAERFKLVVRKEQREMPIMRWCWRATTGASALV